MDASAHVADERLGGAERTDRERAHLAECARCRVAERALRDFLRTLHTALGDDGATLTLPGHGTGGGLAGPVQVPVGELLPDRYEDLGRLGEGGMGEVRRVRDRVLGRVAALKILSERVLGHADLVARFSEETRVAAQLQHPSLVPVYDAGVLADGRPWFTMKEVRGRSLGEALREAPGSGTGFRRSSLLQAFVHVCDAVGYAHASGVVHRDPKPDNVMLGEHGEVLVLDWGLAKRLGSHAIQPDPTGWGDGAGVAIDPRRPATLAGTITGTAAYMAPEQARGEIGTVGPHSDIYALGATLWQILVGRPPFQGAVEDVLVRVGAGEVRPPSAVRADVPRDLDAVVMRAMAAEPAARYPSVRALRDDVVAWLEGRPVSARTPSLPERMWKWVGRNRTVVVPVASTLGVGTVALVALLVAWTLDARRAADSARTAAARALLGEARGLSAERPAEARTALVEARRLGTDAQRRAATLGLDGLAGSLPTPLVRVDLGGQVTDLSVSPDGTRVAAADLVRRRVWRFSLPSGLDLVEGPQGRPGEVVGAGWLDDGRFVRLVAHDGVLDVRDEADARVASFEVGSVVEGARVAARGPEALPGDRFGVPAAIGRDQAAIRVFRLDGTEERTAVDVLPAGRGLAWVGTTGELVDDAGQSLWQGPAFEKVVAVFPDRTIADLAGHRLEARRPGDPTALWSVAGTYTDSPGVALGDRFAMTVVTPGADGNEIEIRRALDGGDAVRLGVAPLPHLNGPGWSASARSLVVSDARGVAVVPVGRSDPSTTRPQVPGGYPVAVSPDGTLVASMGGPGAVDVRSRASRRVLRELPCGEDCVDVRVLRFTDGRTLAVGCEREVRLLDLAGAADRRVPIGARATAIVATPDGLAIATRSGAVAVLDGAGLRTTPLHPGTIWDAELAGDVLVTSGRSPGDERVRAWTWPMLEPLWTFLPTHPLPFQLDVRDGRVAVGTSTGHLSVIDLATGTERWSVRASAQVVLGVGIAPDGVVFTTGVDGSVAAWLDGVELWRWPGAHAEGVQLAVAGDLVVASYFDGSVWWLERGLADRLAVDGPAAVGRRYLAAGIPDLAARALAPVRRESLTREERLLLVEMGIDPVGELVRIDLDTTSEAAWSSLVSRGTDQGSGP